MEKIRYLIRRRILDLLFQFLARVWLRQNQSRRRILRFLRCRLFDLDRLILRRYS
jgi:hypothetical protein